MSTENNTEQKNSNVLKNANIKADRTRAGANAAVSIVGALVILVALNYLAMRHYKRADWTASGLYTLSEKSIKVLETLPKDVSLIVLWSAGDPSGRYSEVKEILDRYTAASPRIKVEMVDPDLNPERVKMVISQYGARIQQDEYGRAGVEAGIFVVSGDNVKFVSSSDFENMTDMLGQMDADDNAGVSGFNAEQSLTSAVLHVTSDSQPKICFTQGHGEWGVESGGTAPSISHLKEALAQDGLKVEAITTLGSGSIPIGCDLVAVVGPEKAFLPEEASLLERYAEQGGKLLLFLDPIMDGKSFLENGLEKLTAKFGIKIHKDLVFEVDRRRLIGNSPYSFLASEFTSHEAVKHLSLPDSVGADIKAEVGAYPVAFSSVRSMSAMSDAPQIVEALAYSSASSWGETDGASIFSEELLPEKDQYDTQGPAVIAMFSALPRQSEGKESGALAVVGDSDVLSAELFVSAGLSNRDFFSGLVGKLTKRPELISIAPKNPEHVKLNLTSEDMSTVNRLIWGEIVFFVILGIAVWLRRRS